MNIKLAIRDFLIDDETLEDVVRDEARQEVRNFVGGSIYDSSRPANSDSVAIVISRGGGLMNNRLDGLELGCKQPIMDFTVWTKDGGTQGSDELIYRNLTTLLHGYRGPLNDEIEVQTIRLEAEPFDRPLRPIDASPRWTHRKTMSFLVAWCERQPELEAASAAVDGIGSMQIGTTFIVR